MLELLSTLGGNLITNALTDSKGLFQVMIITGSNLAPNILLMRMGDMLFELIW